MRWPAGATVLLMLHVLAGAGPAAAQEGAPGWGPDGERTRPAGVHAEVSLLGMAGVGAGGFGGGLGLRGAAAGHRLALRLQLAADLSGFPDSGGGQEITRASLTWTPVGGGGWWPRWLGVGPSVVRFEECPVDDDPCATVGLAGEVDWGRRVTGLAIGGHAFADVNVVAPLLGVSLDVRVGWLR